MHQGMPSNGCIDSTLTCCALEERDSVTRRTVKHERKNNHERIAAQVVAANSPQTLSARSGPERQVRHGYRYEKPVLELKTDLRI
jgi:hypothetical protein